jgi:Lipopolysaccharide export system permease LptF/LptG
MDHDPSSPLPGRFLRRIAERVASKAACDRVLQPLLADLQFEHVNARGPWARGLVRARGVLAFWQAFGVTSVVDSGRHLWTNAWGITEKESHATQRLLVHVGLGATVVTALLLGSEYSHLRSFGSVFFFLIPSMLAVALPIGTLFAFALEEKACADQRRSAPIRVVLLAGLATFAIGAWLNPVANQAFRERVSRAVTTEFVGPLAKGDREMTLDDLAERSSALRSAGHGREAKRFDLEWHKKPAFGASCAALALAGAAIASLIRRRLWQFLAAFAVFNAVYGLLRIGEQAADAGRLAPALAMWGPFLLVAAISLAVLGVAHRRSDAALTSG